MSDILPGEIEKWQWLESRARNFYEAHGFHEIRTPILESTELFVRSIGQATDIVHKEMFSFEDRGGRQMTMRPEMTASIVRAVIQNGLLKTAKSLSLYYTGCMFRAERPQAGRKRQFHQIGIEMINQKGMETDLAVIRNLYDFLKYLGIKNPRVKINDLSITSGPQALKVKQKLKDYFSAHRSQLDPDSVYRLEHNVLRIFDSKQESTQAVIEKAPWNEIAPLGKEFENLCAALERVGIAYEVSRRLVRGLDYYTGAVFEISLPGLGAQDAVAGGGRYDRLFQELGGSEVPCTGFSLGMERLLMAMEKNVPSIQDQIQTGFVYFAPLAASELQAEYETSVAAAMQLKQFGFRVEMGPLAQDLGDHLKKANKLGAKFVVIRGSEEIQKKVWTLKYMDVKKQESVAEQELLNVLIREVKECRKP